MIYIVVIQALILSFSCQSKNGSEKTDSKTRVSRDLLEDFDISEHTYWTRNIEAANPEDEDYFISGWYLPEKNFRWAKEKQSVIQFDAVQTRGLNLEMECRSVNSKNNQKQKMEIFLNSKKIRTIKPDPLFDVYSLPLPDKLIKTGKNTLTFKYRLAERPSDSPDTHDQRLLSAAFKYFKFSWPSEEAVKTPEPLIQKKSGEIIHFPESAFIFYLKPSGPEELDVNISRISKNIAAHMKISSDKGVFKHIRFKKAGSKKINLKDLSGQYIKLVFYLKTKRNLKPSSQDFAVWSGIKILKPVRKAKASQELAELYKKLNSGKFDIVYVALDAFHAKHSSLYGYHRDTTPFLKKMGKEGIVFQNFYANSPYTLASTGTLLTSRYPHEHGVIEKNTKINPSLQTTPEMLSDHEISSFLLTGHPWFRKDWGLTRGFTEIYFDKYYKKNVEYSTSLKTLYSKYKKDKQKFIYIHAHPPHAPYLPPKKFRIFPVPENISLRPTPQNFRKIESGQIKATDDLLDYIESMYDANVLYADSLAEKIYDFFKENKLLDNTIFIFTSDHGDACKMQHGKFGHNTTLFQEMVHIPFIMVFPKKLDIPPSEPQIPACVSDVPVTLLELFGITDDYGLKGKNLLPFILNPEQTSSRVFLENLSGGRQQKGIVEYRYKFISTKDKDMLFDLLNDYQEKTNLVSEMPIEAGYFRELIRSYSSGQVFESEKIDLEKIDKETRERLKSLGYIK